jgi:hypothetical protein
MTLVYTDLLSTPALVISSLYLHHFSQQDLLFHPEDGSSSSTKTLVSICQTMLHHIPEDYNLDTR